MDKFEIKTGQQRRIRLTPCKTGGIVLEHIHGQECTTIEATHLTPDQVGALLFGMESMMERQEVACQI
jgi:hypothetical protein